MAYYTTSSGQVLVPSNQYVNTGAYLNPPPPPPPPQINTYPPQCTVFNDRPLPLPGKYSFAFNKTSSICLGVLLVCCGAAALAGSAIAFRYFAALSDIGAGLWCGAMFVATGSVAIAAGCHLSDTLIRATTGTSAFAIVFGIAVVTISANGLGQDLNYYNCYKWCYDYYGNYNYNCPCYYDNWESFAIIANGILIGAGAIAIIVSFWLFVICCVALCRTPTTRVVPVHVQCVPNPNPQQTITASMIPNQQVLSVPVQYVQLSAAPNQPQTVFHSTVTNTPAHRQPGKSENHHVDEDV